MDLKSLNEEQRRAVETVSGPVLILAGAGTGKTMVITYRIAHLINIGIAPTSILAVTFTNKAANEMQHRVAELVSQRQAKDLTVSTFHSFGLRTLAKYGSLLGYSSGFTLIDYGDQIGIIKQAMSRLSYLDESGFDAAYCLSAVSRAKNKNLRPQDLINADYAEDQKVGRVYEMYQDYLQAVNVMDFDDLIMQTVRLFDDHPQVLEKMRERYRFFLVDEFQDTNFIQMKMIQQLCGENPNICAVGDDDQSIYSWRGAEIQNILNFNQLFTACRVIKLEQNYRCTNNILNCANKVIGINADRHEKNLWSENGNGEKVKLLRCETAEQEASLISEVIQDRVMTQQNEYGDFAVLYRSNHQSQAVELKLRSAKIPYRVIGDKSFYERREIRDAIAFLNVAFNPDNNISLLRILDVPPRGIGPATVKTIRQAADQENISVSNLLDKEEFLDSLGKAQSIAVRNFMTKINRHRSILQTPGSLYEKVKNYFTDIDYFEGIGRMYKPRADAEARYENVMELLHSINEMDKRHDKRMALSDFLRSVSLAEEYSRKKSENEENRNSVTLLTVHAAKGLEFPNVFLIGLEQKLFPHERSLKDRALPEERRLFYVALTRAKKELILSWCHRRKVKQQHMLRKQSQFLLELPEDFTESIRKEDLLQKISTDDMSSYLRSLRDSF